MAVAVADKKTINNWDDFKVLHDFGMIADKISPHRFCGDVAVQCLYIF